MPSLDLAGSLTINPGTSQETIVPLLAGSRGIFDPNLTNVLPASPLIGPINWLSGYVQPVLLARTRLVDNANGRNGWFNTSNIGVMFSRDAYFGQLRDGLGVTQWDYAGEARCWRNSKVSSLALLWEGDRPVEAVLVIMPFGWAMQPRIVQGIATTTFGQTYSSMGVSYGATVTDVTAGSILLSNNLTPLIGSPPFDSFDGQPHPRDYYCGPLSTQVNLFQWSQATRVVEPLSSQIGTLDLRFTKGAGGVLFRNRVKRPTVIHEVRGRFGQVQRVYEGVNANLSTPMVFVG